jgi:hypothetical protein
MAPIAAITTPAPAGADNCSGAGDFGAAAGCAAPGNGSGKTESWPPTSVHWPPDFSSDSDNGGKDANEAAPPIVLPDGQQPHAKSSSGQSDSTSTSTSPTPIVPVGAASLGSSPGSTPTSRPIVTTNSPTP